MTTTRARAGGSYRGARRNAAREPRKNRLLKQERRERGITRSQQDRERRGVAR